MTAVTINEPQIAVTVSEPQIAVTISDAQTNVTESGDTVTLEITEQTTSVTVQQEAISLTVSEPVTTVEITEGITQAQLDNHDHDADYADISHTHAEYLAAADNLSDLASAPIARTNLGLGTLATVDDAPSDGSQYARQDGAWAAVSAGGAALVDTKANILAADAADYDFGIATDTMRLYLSDGSAWYESPLTFNTQVAAPNMGAEQNEGRSGYGDDYITDKRLAHVLIGSNERDEAGAIRVVDGTFQIYANGTWNDVVINFRFREDSAGAYELEHKPIGFDYWYEIMSGNSDQLGIDGRPIVQQYATSMGAYQNRLIVDGGTF
jgi:hypothetical protein